jgi:hypothetical protein
MFIFSQHMCREMADSARRIFQVTRVFLPNEKSAVLSAPNQFKVIGLEFEISTNQITV